MPGLGVGRHSILPMPRFVLGWRRFCWTACCRGARRRRADPGGRCLAMTKHDRAVGGRARTAVAGRRLSVASRLPGCSDVRMACSAWIGSGRTSSRSSSRAPLLIPPDFNLRPPQPGATRPNEVTAAERARRVIDSAGPGEPGKQATSALRASSEGCRPRPARSSTRTSRCRTTAWRAGCSVRATARRVQRPQPRNHAAQGGILTGRRIERDFQILSPDAPRGASFGRVASRLARPDLASRARDRVRGRPRRRNSRSRALRSATACRWSCCRTIGFRR